jgi:uncharacterized protein (DUF2141 family)
MIRALAPLLLMLLTAANFPVPPKAERGRAGADCRAQESGPAFRVEVRGLKDRKGKVILELYPDGPDDFLAADKVLIAEGKVFRRVPMAVPERGPVILCIRAPGPGRYALSVLHDRDENGKFGLFSDGVGASRNPKIGRRKPKPDAVAVSIDSGVTNLPIIMNYQRGFGIGPLPSVDRIVAK